MSTPDLSAWTGEARALAARIVAFSDGSLDGASVESFEALALDLHAFQASRCPVIASLVEGPVRGVSDIPAVPVDVYKSLPVGTVPESEAAVTFLTSGTTGAGRGAHRMRSDALYAHGSVRWAERQVPHAPPRGAHLLLDPQKHPESSLSHMMSLLTPGASWHLGPGGVDVPGFVASLGSTPVYVAATAFALAELVSHPDTRPLPPGSVLMVTGGFKGRVHEVDADALYDLAQHRLRPDRLVMEYGMTELSSQLWGGPRRPYRPPPWLRILAVDPLTEGVQPAGSPGQLRFYDLANLDASLAVETLDEGVVHLDGSVTLFGRLTDAPARGCSLTLEEVWAARDG